jgi:hypothetical protein
MYLLPSFRNRTFHILTLNSPQFKTLSVSYVCGLDFPNLPPCRPSCSPDVFFWMHVSKAGLVSIPTQLLPCLVLHSSIISSWSG